MNKKIKIALLVLILVLVVGGSITVAALSVYKPDAIKNVFNKHYTVVYLDSGQMYVGKLSTFPHLILRGAYALQMVKDSEDDTKTNFQLVPLEDAIWSPQEIRLNKDHIIFTAPVHEDSQVVQSLKGK